MNTDPLHPVVDWSFIPESTSVLVGVTAGQRVDLRNGSYDSGAVSPQYMCVYTEVHIHTEVPFAELFDAFKV